MMTSMAPDNLLTVLAAMFSIGFIGFGIVAVVVTFVQMRHQRLVPEARPRA
jgi:hypothetical protein